MNKAERLAKVATVANEPLARMFAEALDRQGIRCLVKAVGGPGTAGVWPTAVLEHEIWVREDQAGEARAILLDYNGPQSDLTVEY